MSKKQKSPEASDFAKTWWFRDTILKEEEDFCFDVLVVLKKIELLLQSEEEIMGDPFKVNKKFIPLRNEFITLLRKQEIILMKTKSDGGYIPIHDSGEFRYKDASAFYRELEKEFGHIYDLDRDLINRAGRITRTKSAEGLIKMRSLVERIIEDISVWLRESKALRYHIKRLKKKEISELPKKYRWNLKEKF